ncbi:hypothetical protein WA588_004315, partial [Blastocystis sp. NMH]
MSNTVNETSGNTGEAVTMDRETVLKNLKEQLEFLFSVEGLAQNPYIMSNMNDNGFVPMSLVVSYLYPAFPNITVSDIMEAVQSSDKVSVDADTQMIRPNVSVERKTIILRDVPEGTTEEEIRTLFAGLGAIESVKPSIASNWFVVMDSEPTAVSALKSLQSKEFKGSKLHARIKNESVLLSLSRQVAMVAAQFGIAPQGGFFNAFSSPSVFSSANMADAGVNDAEQTFRPAGRRGRGRGSRGRRERAAKPIVLPQIDNPSRFPPLVLTGALESGYRGEFIKYTPAEILSIVREMSDLSLPAVASEAGEVLSEVANAELAGKQRTQSMDASLAAGMPRTYSVDSVDYTTMLLGDVAEEVKAEARKRRRQRKGKKLDFAKAIAKPKVEESSKESVKESVKESSKDANKEATKEATKEPVKPVAKEAIKSDKGKKEEKKPKREPRGKGRAEKLKKEEQKDA